MNTRFAAALNDQGRFANTCVGDFNFVPEGGAHIWKGKIATSAGELAEHVNGAIIALAELADPFASLRVIEIVDANASPDENASTPESENEALRQTIRELQQTIATLQRPAGPTLKILEEAAA